MCSRAQVAQPSRALRARGMRIASTIGTLARALAIGAALMGATAYGYFIHRNHAFPYGLLNPQAGEFADPWQSPAFRMRNRVILSTNDRSIQIDTVHRNGRSAESFASSRVSVFM
jgi:hypothetical protein